MFNGIMVLRPSKETHKTSTSYFVVVLPFFFFLVLLLLFSRAVHPASFRFRLCLAVHAYLMLLYTSPPRWESRPVYGHVRAHALDVLHNRASRLNNAFSCLFFICFVAFFFSPSAAGNPRVGGARDRPTQTPRTQSR